MSVSKYYPEEQVGTPTSLSMGLTISIMSEGLSPHGYFINLEFFHFPAEIAAYLIGTEREIHRFRNK